MRYHISLFLLFSTLQYPGVPAVRKPNPAALKTGLLDDQKHSLILNKVNRGMFSVRPTHQMSPHIVMGKIILQVPHFVIVCSSRCQILTNHLLDMLRLSLTNSLMICKIAL